MEREELLEERKKRTTKGGFFSNLPFIWKIIFVLANAGVLIYWFTLSNTTPEQLYAKNMTTGELIPVPIETSQTPWGLIFLLLIFDGFLVWQYRDPRKEDYGPHECRTFALEELQYLSDINNKAYPPNADKTLTDITLPKFRNTDEGQELYAYEFCAKIKIGNSTDYKGLTLSTKDGKLIRTRNLTKPLRGDEEPEEKIIIGKEYADMMKGARQVQKEYGVSMFKNRPGGGMGGGNFGPPQ